MHKKHSGDFTNIISNECSFATEEQTKYYIPFFILPYMYECLTITEQGLNTEPQQLTIRQKNITLTIYTVLYDKYYIILTNRLVINCLTIIFEKVST